MGPLGVQGIDGDDRAGQVQLGDQRGELADLAAFIRDLRWASTIEPWWVTAASRCGPGWPPAAVPRTLLLSMATPASRGLLS